MPRTPGVKTGGDRLQGENFGMKPGALDFMRQMPCPRFRESWTSGQMAPEIAQLERPNCGRRFRNRIAMVARGVDRRFRKHGPHSRTLQHKGGPVWLVTHEVDDP